MKHPRKLSHSFSGTLRTFSFWVANGTVGLPLLEGVNYRQVMLEEPSMLEQVYAIFANVLEFNEDGQPVNAKYAEYRAAQYIRTMLSHLRLRLGSKSFMSRHPEKIQSHGHFASRPNNTLNTDRPNAGAFGSAPRVRGAGGLA